MSAVEADTNVSNQHEFNGVAGLKDLFGEGKQKYPAKFVYLSDDEQPVTDGGFLTWYDARERHPTRSEYRLYFPTTNATSWAQAGDLLVIGYLNDNDRVIVIIAEANSTISNQVLWLFGLQHTSLERFSVRENLESEHDQIAFASRIILEQIGIEVDIEEENFLDGILSRFGPAFPGTMVFSEYARSTISDVDPTRCPDVTLMTWVEREEVLFRTLEKHIVSEQLEKGFDDVDSFISFSLSVLNRRKSRAGHALENHLEKIFLLNGLYYSRGRQTENGSKPDFVFPSIERYHDPQFDTFLLTMLGAKSTCKDRWRQVLAEADRIENKHLITLEPAISVSQTNEMISRNLQLVLPSALHDTYAESQRNWLMRLEDFLGLVTEKQSRAAVQFRGEGRPRKTLCK